jgi:hypothetical protein
MFFNKLIHDIKLVMDVAENDSQPDLLEVIWLTGGFLLETKS